MPNNLKIRQQTQHIAGEYAEDGYLEAKFQDLTSQEILNRTNDNVAWNATQRDQNIKSSKHGANNGI